MQAVSSRPDVAPPSYTRELEKLQDQIPPFPNSDAMAVIEEDTGRVITSMFSYISPEPIAAASLGQVRPFFCMRMARASLSFVSQRAEISGAQHLASMATYRKISIFDTGMMGLAWLTSICVVYSNADLEAAWWST